MAKKFQPKSYVRINHPKWAKKSVIYQINTRQFTPEGTFAAATEQLPRLAELGVDILWLMPIHPIGEVHRKGTLGSPYAVKDYFAVNPEFGTEADLHTFIDTAHRLGFKVILDWVANHTAWDNQLTIKHPDWYIKDWNGNFRPTPWWDWDDIIDLDYSVPAVRRYMTRALKYWVREFDVDGYRCDVAGLVPTDFWNTARRELDRIKPVFMLAEWESKDLHEHAFDMTYAWSWFESLHHLCRDGKDLGGLYGYMAWNAKHWPSEAMRMLFTSNHDKNSWDGTEFEIFGAGVKAAIVLSFIAEGMPLIYNGQEAGNQKRLEFFEKDPIEWRHHEHGDLFKQLIAIKHNNPALWNAPWGAHMEQVKSDAPMVFAFVRETYGNKVFAFFNFSGSDVEVGFHPGPQYGRYVDAFTGAEIEISDSTVLHTQGWGYRVLLATD